jgi:3-deoxy-D-manno-octulosonic-acid transferase
MLASADLICAQSALDAQRLRNLGVDGRLIHVTGNLKFDTPQPASIAAAGRDLRAQLGPRRPVLIAASTHTGEERQLLDALAVLRRRYPELLLVLVPRHPERFGSVTRLAERRGFTTQRKTALAGPLAPEVQVLVGDTMGELQWLYAAADIAFIGGSLVAHGGQNPLEAYAVGVPAIFGPHMFHFEEISAMSLDRGAARQVRDGSELVEAVALYLDQPALRTAAASAAHSLIADNRGALERTLALMTRQSSAPFDVAAAALDLGGRPELTR